MKRRLLSTARLSFPLATALAALLTAQSASAATFYWDSTPTPSTAGFGTAAGTWVSQNAISGSGRWTTSATGILSGSASQATTSADAFNYGTVTNGLATGSIAIGGTSATPINVGSITFGAASGTITLNGGFLAFGTAKSITVNNTTNTINSVIQGGNGFTKTGSGTLILGGDNTFGGTLTVANNGILVLSGDNSSMSANVSLSANTSLVPKLHINSATALGTGTLSFGGGAATDTVQIDNTSVGGAVTLSTANAITLNRNFSFVGTQSLHLGTGTATLGGLTTGTARNITVTANTLTFGGIVTEGATTNLGITKFGTGTLVLANTNSYTGTTTVSTGTLQLDGSTAASSTVAVGTNGTLTGTGTVNGNATLTGNGTINKSSGTLAGTLAVTGGKWNSAGAVTGLVTSSSGTFTIGNGANLTANGDLAVIGGTITAGNATSTITGNVNYTSGSNSTFAGIIAGSGKTLTLDNAAATLTLSGASTYTGQTTVAAGVLAVNGSLANTTTTVAATLQGSGTLGGSVTIQDGGVLAPGNSIESLGVASVDFLAGSTYAYELNSAALNGDLTYSSGALGITSGIGSAGTTLTLTELFSGTLAVNDKLTLISYTGGWTSGELFNYLGGTLADDSTFTLGANQWLFNYNDTTGGSNFSGDQTAAASFVTMTVVIPEPDAAALLGALGALALLRRRR